MLNTAKVERSWFRAAVPFTTILACAQGNLDGDASQVDPYSTPSLPEALRELESGALETASPQRREVRVRTDVGNLSVARSKVLDGKAQPLLQRLAAVSKESAPERPLVSGNSVDRNETPPVAADEQESVLSGGPGDYDGSRNSENASASHESAPAPDVKELWRQFLGAVYESPTGGFAIGDVFFHSEEDLLRHFEALYLGRVDKGLILPGSEWPRQGCAPFCLDPPYVTVCWTPDSDATNAEKAIVAELVNASWAAVTDTVFDFGSGSAFRTCEEEPCGFRDCSTGGEDIRIFQSWFIQRGCAATGVGHTNSGNGVDCGDGELHDYASMYLPTRATMIVPSPPAAPFQASPIWVDHTTVHEFGHAIGLLHEQDRDDYIVGTCDSADGTLATTNGQLNIGASPDGNSIMHYCQSELNLNGGQSFIDPRATELSVGDIFAARALYEARDYQVLFDYTSWYNDQVQLSLDLVNAPSTQWTVNGQQGSQTFATGLSGFVGDDYTVSASAVNNAQLSCSATKPGAVGVFNAPRIIPPGGFQERPVLATCYDAAAVAVINDSVLQ